MIKPKKRINANISFFIRDPYAIVSISHPPPSPPLKTVTGG